MGGETTFFTSLVIVNAVLVWFTFACCTACLFSPAWITLSPKEPDPGRRSPDQIMSKSHMGLVVYCVSGNAEANALSDCTWFKEGKMKTPDWLAASRALVGAAACVYLVAAACSTVLFFEALRNPECSSLLIASTFLGMGGIVSATVTFGIKANGDFSAKMNRTHSVIFDWGYYLAIIASAFAICSFVAIVMVISFITRKGQKRYSEVITPTAKA